MITGHSGLSAVQVGSCGACSSSTMIVMMIAITPSLNASRRFGFMAVRDSRWRAAELGSWEACRTVPGNRRRAKRAAALIIRAWSRRGHAALAGSLRSWHRDREAELHLTVLPVLLRHVEHVTQHREQLLLRRRYERVGDLRLLPEDAPVRLLCRVGAVHLRLPRRAVAAGEILTERAIHSANAFREHRVGVPERGLLRAAEEQRVGLLEQRLVHARGVRHIERSDRVGRAAPPSLGRLHRLDGATKLLEPVIGGEL